MTRRQATNYLEVNCPNCNRIRKLFKTANSLLQESMKIDQPNLRRAKAWAPFDDFPRIFRKNKRNLSRGAETRNSALLHLVIGERKRTNASRNFQKREVNNQRNSLVKPKKEILKMCYFLKIERKFQRNE